MIGSGPDRKIELAKEILDDRVDETPCAYSVQELEQRLNEAEEEFERGKGIEHTDIKRK